MNRSRPWPIWSVLVCWALMPSGGLAQVVVENPAARNAVPQPIARGQAVMVAAEEEEEEEERIPANDVRFLFRAIVDVLDGKQPLSPPAAVAPVVRVAAPAALAGPIAVEVEEAVDDVDSLFQGMVDALEGINDPNIRNMERQFLPQFQQVLYSELAFVRRVCRLDAAQFRPLAQSSRRRLRDAVREYVVAQTRPRQTPTTLDPRMLIAQQVAALVESTLPPEQATRYREGCDQREASRRRAAVMNLVARLDEQLVLSAEQREKLVQSLVSDYQEPWGQWLEIQVHNPQFFPEIPDASVVPLLNEKQRTVWRQMPKQNVHFFGVIQFGGAAGMLNPRELEEIRRIAEEGKDDE